MQEQLFVSLAAQRKMFHDGIDAIDVLVRALRATPPAPRGRSEVQAAEAPTRTKKRKLSPESRQRIVDATKRRWAAKRQNAAVQAANGAEAIA